MVYQIEINITKTFPFSSILVMFIFVLVLKKVHVRLCCGDDVGNAGCR